MVRTQDEIAAAFKKASEDIGSVIRDLADRLGKGGHRGTIRYSVDLEVLAQAEPNCSCNPPDGGGLIAEPDLRGCPVHDKPAMELSVKSAANFARQIPSQPD